MYEITNGEITISCDPAKLDIDFIHKFLSEECYWAFGRAYAKVKRAIEHSLNFGLYDQSRQVGFARVITDYTHFAWLCDVFVIHEYRGKGLGKQLIDAIMNHPELQGMRRFLLATRDAEKLYHSYGGFVPLHAPERWMEYFKIR